MSAPELAEIVSAESEWRAEGELVGRQRRGIERRAEPSIHEHPVSPTETPEFSRRSRQLCQRCVVGEGLVANDDIGAVEDVRQAHLR